MASWRDSILKHFKPGIAHLALVSDPDGLVTEEGTLAAIKERGFDVIPFEDSIAFRYAYESKYRSAWDRGEGTDLLVVLRGDRDLGTLPYDLLKAARTLEFSLHKLFPNLNYPVLETLDSSHLDALWDAYQQEHESKLGEKLTKDFILTHCFRIVPSLVSSPVDLLKVLLSRHYREVAVPAPLLNHLLDQLQAKPQFSDWPLADILSNRQAFLRFLQEQWPIYLGSLRGGSTSVVPFDHPDIRAYVDTMFLEGLLHPVRVEDAESMPSWTHIGIEHDPKADALDRMQKLVERCDASIPKEDALHRQWQKFARTWAELVLLRWELSGSLDDDALEQWNTLHEQVEGEFAAWMLNRFGSLHNLPFVPQPIMVHHIPRYLAAERNERGMRRVALIVVDGLAFDQWLLLRRCLEGMDPSWRFDESTVFAWAPTLTSISRQSIFAAEPPLYFPESLDTTHREGKHWSRFWENQGIPERAIEYAKMVESAESEALDACLGNPHVTILAVVANTVDKIMHGEQQGTAGMHDAIRRWFTEAHSLLERLLTEGFEVFLTADHGNVASTGMGQPKEGVLVEVGGKRARIYDSPTFRDEAKGEYPDTIEWPNVGLPPDRHVLLPKGLAAFTTEDKQVVSHGGIALEEVIVPFVRIYKEEE